MLLPFDPKDGQSPTNGPPHSPKINTGLTAGRRSKIPCTSLGLTRSFRLVKEKKFASIGLYHAPQFFYLIYWTVLYQESLRLCHSHYVGGAGLEWQMVNSPGVYKYAPERSTYKVNIFS